MCILEQCTIFCAALQDFPQLSRKKSDDSVPQGKPMAWILTIARNLSLEKLRKQSRIQELSDSQWETFAVENPAFTTEDRMVLHAALYSLSEEEQRIV